MPDILDPDYRRIVETARAWGVPVSTFLGQATHVSHVTVHGQVSTEIRPGWGEEDRQAAIDLAVYEETLCGGCGQSMHETCNPENEGKYVAGKAIRCHRCTAQMAAMPLYEDSPHPSALAIPVSLRGAHDVTDV